MILLGRGPIPRFHRAAHLGRSNFGGFSFLHRLAADVRYLAIQGIIIVTNTVRS